MSTVSTQNLANITWGEPYAALRLGLVTHGTAVTFYLQNVGSIPLSVLSYVQAHEQHFDWYTLHVQLESERRILRFDDDRKESEIVYVQLAPGAHIHHTVDVTGWAARPVNGAQLLTPNTYQVYAIYSVPMLVAHWSGKIEAGPATLTINTQPSL